MQSLDDENEDQLDENEVEQDEVDDPQQPSRPIDEPSDTPAPIDNPQVTAAPISMPKITPAPVNIPAVTPAPIPVVVNECDAALKNLLRVTCTRTESTRLWYWDIWVNLAGGVSATARRELADAYFVAGTKHGAGHHKHGHQNIHAAARETTDCQNKMQEVVKWTLTSDDCFYLKGNSHTVTGRAKVVLEREWPRDQEE